MANALLDAVSVKIAVGDYLFTASGFTVKFDGYTQLYEVVQENEEEAAKHCRSLPREMC